MARIRGGILTQGPLTRVLGLADGRRQADRTAAAHGAHVTGWHPVRSGHGMVQFENALERHCIGFLARHPGFLRIKSQPTTISFRACVPTPIIRSAAPLHRSATNDGRHGASLSTSVACRIAVTSSARGAFIFARNVAFARRCRATFPWQRSVIGYMLVSDLPGQLFAREQVLRNPITGLRPCPGQRRVRHPTVEQDCSKAGRSPTRRSDAVSLLGGLRVQERPPTNVAPAYLCPISHTFQDFHDLIEVLVRNRPHASGERHATRQPIRNRKPASSLPASMGSSCGGWEFAQVGNRCPPS